MNEDVLPASRRRLNPFIFPSDTAVRFGLLILSAVATALFAYNWIYFAVTSRRHELIASLRCALAAGPAAAGLGDPQAYATRSKHLQGCLASINHPKGYFMLAGAGATVAVASLLYLLVPLWKLRRGKLKSITEEDAPGVPDELGRLARDAGLTRVPRFVWNPLRGTPTGVAFGRLGRHYVGLTGGLVRMFYSDLPSFRAIALHELAHLRNRDVDRTYFTVTLWYALFLVAIIPLLVTIVGEGAGVVLPILWRLAALTLLVYLIRNAVLRSRETYADLRADTTGGHERIRAVLGASREPKRSWLRGLIRVHPPTETRLAALDTTDGLFTARAITESCGCA